MELARIYKKQRLKMMIFGAAAIFFTGFPHIWSVYQPYVIEQTGWTQAEASMCFYLALGVFVIGNIVGGRLQNRYHPRIVVLIGGGIFTVGILASAFLILPSPIPMYVTYGVMQGFGQGMIYAAIISTAQKWFPGRTGFASGIIVTANGLCGFFLAPVSRKLLETGGLEMALIVIGMAIAVSWILCSMFFSVPDETWSEETEAISEQENKNLKGIVQRQYTSGEMMRTKRFYLLLATMFFGLLSYFILSPVSQAYQIELGIPAAAAVSAVMIGSVANAGMRLLIPTLSDKIGRTGCIKAVLVVSIAAMAVLSISGSWLVTAAIVVMYGCYGGIMGSFPSFTSSIFGLEHSGENYGYVMFGIVFATFAVPVLTNMMTMLGFGMQEMFMLGVVSAILALICMILLEKELKKM